MNIIKSTEGQSKCPLDQRELAFNIIAYLSTDFRTHQKEFRRKGGIELIKSNLAFSDVDQSGNSTTFLLSVMDCLAQSVYGNKRSELHFLDIEGVYVLLDLIETCDESLKRLALASLCTILENNKSFQYFIEWNSTRSNLNATQLLIKLYQAEDVRFCVKYDTKGVLETTERPLVPQESYLSRKYGEESANMINITQVKENTTMGVSPDRASEMSATNVFKEENKSRLSQRSHNTTKSVITQQNMALLNASKASKGLKQALEAA